MIRYRLTGDTTKLILVKEHPSTWAEYYRYNKPTQEKLSFGSENDPRRGQYIFLDIIERCEAYAKIRLYRRDGSINEGWTFMGLAHIELHYVGDVFDGRFNASNAADPKGCV